MNTGNILFEDLLDTIFLEESEPSYDALSRWIARFPEHQEALTSFFATWAIQQEMLECTKVDEEGIASRIVSRTLNKEYQRTLVKKAHLSGDTLLSAATRSGMGILDLANRTNLDDSILMKLDRRRVVGIIPRVCVEALSSAIGMAVDEIRMLITGPPLPLAGVRYKSKSKPETKTESFSDAIKASFLSAELKTYWIAEIENEEQK